MKYDENDPKSLKIEIERLLKVAEKEGSEKAYADANRLVIKMKAISDRKRKKGANCLFIATEIIDTATLDE